MKVQTASHPARVSAADTSLLKSPRMLRVGAALLALLAFSATAAQAQVYQWTNYAGTTGGGSTDGTGSAARLNFPQGVAVDSSGNVYAADTGNHTIRKITSGGVVTTFAGLAGTPGSADGAGSTARFFRPTSVAVDSSGNVYVADSYNHTIRMVTPGGMVSTLAGQTGSAGGTDATGSAARFNFPQGIAVDASGNVYVADTNNNTIRKVTSTGVVTTLAGLSGTPGTSDGTGSAARFSSPQGVAADAGGTVYVADTSNNTIRKVTSAGVVTTLAGFAGINGSTDATGSAARFDHPRGITADASGTIYVGDASSNTIRKVTSAGVVTTMAGSAGNSGSKDATGSAARFFSPQGVAVDSGGYVYVADSFNNTIRKVAAGGAVSTLAGQGGGGIGATDATGSDARFNYPGAVGVDTSGNLYVADTSNNTLRKVTSSGVVTTLAGIASLSGSFDGSYGVSMLYQPAGVAVDSSSNVYVADSGNNTIRKVTSAGVTSTLAGLAGSTGSTDATGTSARFNTPKSVAVDGSGNVYVADTGNHTIRKVTSAGVVTTLAGSAGSAGSTNGTGSAARFSSPQGIAVDSSGNVYVTDTGNHTIRKVTSAGVVTTFAGTAGSSGSTDATGSAARFSAPRGIAVDSSGNLYVADTGNSTLRKVTSAGVVTTLAGQAGSSGSTDGTGTAALFSSPQGIAVDSSSNVYVADTANSTLRKMTSGSVVTTLAGLAGGSVGSSDGTGTAARFDYPSGVAADSSGNVYVADTYNYTIRKVTSGGVVTVLAGLAGTNGSTDATGTAARFNVPYGVAADSSGNVYVADTFSHTIRKITPAGVVSTLAGLVANSGSTDGSGSAARFNSPQSLTVDSSGNVYVADSQNCTIRKITPAGVVSTLAGLAGSYGSTDGAGSAARFTFPRGIAADSSGNLYVADSSNYTIRKVTPGGVVTTVAGLAGSYGSTDATGSSARFISPAGVVVDSAGNVFVADYNTIRRITPSGVVTTLGGLADSPGSVDGPGSAARFYKPSSLAVDSSGSIYVADAGTNRIIQGTALQDIAVQQPNGLIIPPGSTQNLGPVVQGGTLSFTFTVSNPGTQSLTGLAVTKDGANAADFSITSSPAASLNPGGTTTFAILFTPSGNGAQTVTETATIHLANSVPGKSPYDIVLSATMLSSTYSTGNDGMSDAAKFLLSPLGFNWQISQPALVSAYYSNSAAANLYNKTQYDANRTAGQNDVTTAPNTYGLYTPSQVQTLNVGTPLLTKNQGTGQFKLTLGIQQTPDLTQPFTSLPMTAPATSINAQGQMEFLFTAPGNAAFFRVQAQ